MLLLLLCSKKSNFVLSINLMAELFRRRRPIFLVSLLHLLFIKLFFGIFKFNRRFIYITYITHIDIIITITIIHIFIRY